MVKRLPLIVFLALSLLLAFPVGAAFAEQVNQADLVAQADQAVKDGKYADAINLYTQALQQSPNDPAILTKRCEAYRLSGDLAKAIDDCRAVVNAGRATADTYFSLAQAVNSRSKANFDAWKADKNEAIGWAGAAVVANPANAAYHRFLADRYSDLKRLLDALAAANMAVALEPSEASYRTRQGIYDGLKQRDKSIEDLLRAWSINPRSTSTPCDLRARYVDWYGTGDTNRLDDAIMWGRSCVANRDAARASLRDRAGARRDLAAALRAKGDLAAAAGFDAATPFYNEALQLLMEGLSLNQQDEAASPSAASAGGLRAAYAALGDLYNRDYFRRFRGNLDTLIDYRQQQLQWARTAAARGATPGILRDLAGALVSLYSTAGDAISAERRITGATSSKYEALRNDALLLEALDVAQRSLDMAMNTSATSLGEVHDSLRAVSARISDAAGARVYIGDAPTTRINLLTQAAALDNWNIDNFRDLGGIFIGRSGCHDRLAGIQYLLRAADLLPPFSATRTGDLARIRSTMTSACVP